MSQNTQKIFEPVLTKAIDELRQGEAFAPSTSDTEPQKRKAYIETYGCQMNFSDTEIIASVLAENGFGFSTSETEADLVLLNTCAIRENAETKIWHRLKGLKVLKKKKPSLIVGVMGCMAERLKKTLLEQEQLVDIVVGPDAYRSLPLLIASVDDGQKAVNVLLSRDETYADLAPVRLNTNGVSAFISITRGCNNMCSFCVVPFTRGRERSREYGSILQEAESLITNGYREITLLGQNVDSYTYEDCNFAQLLAKVAALDSTLRIRFSTSHPKDITDEVLETIAQYPNICNYIHLPVQSGSSRILEKMNRGYTREWYLERVHRIRTLIPHCAISTDIITGFCSETEADHDETLSLMREVKFDAAYMFFYSERPGTLAARQYTNDVPEELKKRRLREVIDLQNIHSLEHNLACVGGQFQVLVEGKAKRSEEQLMGRTDGNKTIVFPKTDHLQPGDFTEISVISASSATLIGEIVA